MRKTKIIAIGGGSVYVPCQPATTLAIDREAVRLAASELPIGKTINMLFIPTASGDDIGYCHGIYTHFHLRLGCNYDHLRLLAEETSRRQIADKIGWADIIYVGGGNTRKMMRVWREFGVTEHLQEAYLEGKVLMGLSAGSICWFEGGLSDSEKLDGKPDWKPVWVDGLGLIPILHSPHLDSEAWRLEELEKYRQQGTLKKSVLALEDNCALEMVGDQYRLISSRPEKVGYLYGGKTRIKIRPSEEFQPFTSLT